MSHCCPEQGHPSHPGGQHIRFSEAGQLAPNPLVFLHTWLLRLGLQGSKQSPATFAVRHQSLSHIRLGEGAKLLKRGSIIIPFIARLGTSDIAKTIWNRSIQFCPMVLPPHIRMEPVSSSTQSHLTHLLCENRWTHGESVWPGGSYLSNQAAVNIAAWQTAKETENDGSSSLAMRLANPVYDNSFVAIANVPGPDEMLPYGFTCYITGLGLMDSENTRLHAFLAILTHNNLSSTYMSKRDDSGGPLSRFTDGAWRVHGVVSHGPSGECNQVSKPTVFTRRGVYIVILVRKVHHAKAAESLGARLLLLLPLIWAANAFTVAALPATSGAAPRVAEAQNAVQALLIHIQLRAMLTLALARLGVLALTRGLFSPAAASSELKGKEGTAGEVFASSVHDCSSSLFSSSSFMMVWM
ncbi:Chymotrypsin-C [Liparis tanakae]|uniref:Chymotrypsin-C n=1 Tax=Liparis tanakae TaxID=230148 RepID=A0A4Z2JDR9_9TELE|nr:Chymotrypsin-C [Liparis tanakae]